MWQEILVYAIGVLVVIHLLRKCYLFFCSRKKQKNRCDDCPGCILNPKK